MASERLTAAAKQLLSTTIRALRERLLRDIHDEADRRYRLSVTLQEAGLDEVHRRRRERLEGWLDERVRASKPKNQAEEKSTRSRLLKQAEKEAAATLVNRLIVLRHMEALGLSKPAVVTGGWNSKGYREFRGFAATLCTSGTSDETEGYATLLQLLFDELAIDLPGLFGDVGLTQLFAIPAATLREIIEKLDVPELASAWTDDTTLGWVYQYWNDPEREALDAKIADGGKIEPHEIACKTQMFTERYMVEWLLQNSLGLTWLCICKKNGWTPDAAPVLNDLDARRTEWRTRREAGEVALDALMPIHGELEDHWKYFVPQPIPDDAVAQAPDSIRTVKLLDPATGSGHFLVIAFGLLTAMYREEAKHRGETISDRAIAESILENNLFGIDIDPRAIQIAAAALYLKAKSLSKDARPKSLNLVAPVFQLGTLPADDPAVVKLRQDLKNDVGIAEEVTNHLLKSLSGVDYLGSLFKVDAALNETIKSHEQGRRAGAQLPLGETVTSVRWRDSESVRLALIEKLEHFLAQHSRSEDLGLRLDGAQLAAGVRFVRMVRPSSYDVVIGNPPYHSTSKLGFSKPFVDLYPEARADLFAAFYVRALELTRPGGHCGYVTLSNWMFLGSFERLRKRMIREGIRLIADFGKGAFSQASKLITSSACILSPGRSTSPVALRAFERAGELLADQVTRIESALLGQVNRSDFDPQAFMHIDGQPIVYGWDKKVLANYAAVPKLGELASVRTGMQTGDNTRFLRSYFEVAPQKISLSLGKNLERAWTPYIKGAAGLAWFEPLQDVINWSMMGLQVALSPRSTYGSSSEYYFRLGISYTTIGTAFVARAHRIPSIFDISGSSVFPNNIPNVLCAMNAGISKAILQSLNPTVNFQPGDVKRLPIKLISDATEICSVVERGFLESESSRESSLEFRHPGPSPWAYAQEWAQIAVDRAEGAPLLPYIPVYDAPTAEAFISFALGIALGRFGAAGEGILADAPRSALAGGILFVAPGEQYSLAHAACTPLVEAWNIHGSAVGGGDDLRTYLRKSFFAYHKKLYENRPIYFPLSSSKKSYVAFVSIHRWQDDTLQVLLADHLMPEKRRLEGELEDIKKARAEAASKSAAERRFADIQKLFDELNDFIEKVTELSEKGPPPSDASTTPREVDARYTMDLDDGVMVNSAALWPLLEPQWKEPKKWWKELANAKGRKDYDWSHLAARYFPTRVRAKCIDDPSLAVAHKCFWQLHPAKAHAWELRLQDEIRPDFTIDEPDSNEARAKFLKDHAAQAKELLAVEIKRRERKAAKAEDAGADGELFDSDAEDAAEDAADE